MKAAKKQAKPKVEIVVGTCSGSDDDEHMELAKRQYFPGLTIKSVCPKCGAPWKRDMGHDYLSYPTVGEPVDASGYCTATKNGEECGHEWPVMVIVRLTLEPAP